jgi:hypothetical protein
VVVTSVVLESLLVSEDPEVEEDELCDSPDAVDVSVIVDFWVMVLPRESVVVYVLTTPGCVVVLVYIEPWLSVLTIITGMTPVKPFEGLAVAVTVDGELDTVVVFSKVTGYSRVRVEPFWVVVTVTVDTDTSSTVVVASAPPLAEDPLIVTVVVTCVARLLA